jgi:hypothetical protein
MLQHSTYIPGWHCIEPAAVAQVYLALQCCLCSRRLVAELSQLRNADLVLPQSILHSSRKTASSDVHIILPCCAALISHWIATNRSTKDVTCSKCTLSRVFIMTAVTGQAQIGSCMLRAVLGVARHACELAQYWLTSRCGSAWMRRTVL